MGGLNTEKENLLVQFRTGKTTKSGANSARRRTVVALTLIGLSLLLFNASRSEIVDNQTQVLAGSENLALDIGIGIDSAPQAPALSLTRFSPTRVDPNGPVATRGQWVDPQSSGAPWETINSTANGLLTFRGNPTRTFHGQGEVGSTISEKWSAEIGCANSPVAGIDKVWCGSGWTGQPLVIPSPQQPNDSWVVVGGYNRALNFFDPDTGEEVFGKYETGDIIKGTPTADPDGFPLIYTGSRDDHFHIVALDQEEPVALWKIEPEQVRSTMWNNDWDSSALVIDDYLFIGGENSRFYIVKLNRSFDEDGNVAVDPQEVFSTPSWDSELLDNIGDQEVSIENSVAISDNTVYFANSGGLVQGWDIEGLERGVQPTRSFRYWVGDDVDASLVIDDDGHLYLGAQYQRQTQRSDERGQIFKLDPENTQDPVVWSRKVETGDETGVWATPALYEDLVIIPTSDGRVLGLNQDNGATAWELDHGTTIWSSPVVVDDHLIQADCNGDISSYSLNGDAPERIWRHTVTNGDCIESTPAFWNGSIYVGARNGDFYALATS